MLFRSNLSSRIEGLTKLYGVSIAIGKALHDKLAEFAALEMDLVRVVGRDTPERVFVLLGDEELTGSPDFADLREAHNAMLAAYRAAQWDDARSQMSMLASHAGQFGLSQLYAMYDTRIAALIADPPPAGWDGVYEAREK